MAVWRDLPRSWAALSGIDRKSTRLNSSHLVISYAVFCLKKKKKKQITDVLKNAIEKVEDLVESYKQGELEQMPGLSIEETLEVEAMQMLYRTRDQNGQIS